MIHWLVGPLVDAHRREIEFLHGRVVALEQARRVDLTAHEARVSAIEKRMEAQRKELREEWQHERQRYERAIDACRLAHLNVAPISAPLIPDTTPTMTTVDAIESFLANVEVDAMGRAPEVGAER